MQVIIVGAGKVGSALAASLLHRDDDVVLIDQGEEWLERVRHLDCKKISGVVIDEDVLESADIASADVVCAVTQVDNINMMVSLMAKHRYGVKRVISRLFDPDKKLVFQELGLDAVNATQITVDVILREIDDVASVMSHKLLGHQITYHTVPVDADLESQSLCDIVTNDGQLILGLMRDGILHPASADIELKKGDLIVLVEVL